MNLNISTGLKSYDLTDENGNVLCTVRFNPTDPTFAQRLYEGFAGLGEKDEQFHRRIVDESDPVKIFGVACEADTEMRKTIDGILGPGTCQAIYGTANVYYARAENGVPLWADLLLTIMDEMDSAVERANKAADPRLQKYMTKFGKNAG